MTGPKITQRNDGDDDLLAQAPEVIRLIGWLATAPPNDRLIYHIGVICADAEKDELVARVRDLAWKAAEAGQVRLVQRRVSGARYAYVAVKRSPIVRVPL